MFDIGFPELALVSVVALLVLGPQRLPETLRTLGLWIGRMRRSFARVKVEVEREIGMDEVRRQLHNEAVMEQMKDIERDVQGLRNDLREPLTTASEGPVGAQAVEPDAPLAPPPSPTPNAADAAEATPARQASDAAQQAATAARATEAWNADPRA